MNESQKNDSVMGIPLSKVTMIPLFSRTNPKALPSICILIACLTLTCWTTGTRAQGFDATTLRQPVNIAEGWLVHAGDDPAYAHPEFDDSHWIPFNAGSDSLRAKLPNSQPEVVWYRLHVKLAPDEHNLSLHTTGMPAPWEIYVNGARVAKACSFSPYISCASDNHMLIPISDKLLAGGSLVIALRVYISRFAWNSLLQPGFVSYQLTFGQQEGMREHMWYWLAGGSALDWLDDLIRWGMMLGALLLYSTQRNRREYLWLFLWNAVEIPQRLLVLYGVLHSYPTYWTAVVTVPVLLWVYCMTRMYCAFASHRIGWKLNLFLVFTYLSFAIYVGAIFLSVQSLNFQLFYFVPVALLGLGILPWILIADIRRGRRETAFLLVPLLLRHFFYAVVPVVYILSQIPALRYKAYALFTHLAFPQFGSLSINTPDVGDFLSMSSLALIVLIRSNRTSRQQALLESEMANAREVQQVILPEAVDTIPGFHIESVYEPAREVGGDFFQVLPAPDNGLILVIGDVAGKGLPAAMLVSVLVGATRTAAQYDPSPAAILGQLNAHLVGRTNGGFCTALAAHITAEGVVSIANAGHLPPYLDGKEMELPGALPLGIVSGISYEVTRIDLRPGSRLTFYSDGVVEAQNKRGQLFGFERAREFSTQPAAAIAEAAKAFGQEDDITVITVRLVAAEKRSEVKLTSAVCAPA
jgi:hypothetical protein